MCELLITLMQVSLAIQVYSALLKENGVGMSCQTHFIRYFLIFLLYSLQFFSLKHLYTQLLYCDLKALLSLLVSHESIYLATTICV